MFKQINLNKHIGVPTGYLITAIFQNKYYYYRYEVPIQKPIRLLFLLKIS